MRATVSIQADKLCEAVVKDMAKFECERRPAYRNGFCFRVRAAFFRPWPSQPSK